MIAAIDTLERVLSTVGYLRVTVGATDRDDWLPCAPLTSDPDHLLALVRPTAADRGTDRDDVAMSLFVQGYAFRVASVAVGGWLLDDRVIDVDPAGMSIALGRARPNAVHFEDVRVVSTNDPLAGMHEVVVEGHLARLVDTAHDACRVGKPLLWSNIGAGFASAFGAFMGPLPERHTEIRDRFTEFLGTARPELEGSGRIEPVGPVWAWERSACCLWYKTESGFQCEDCSLWSADERQARYVTVLSELAE